MEKYYRNDRYSTAEVADKIYEMCDDWRIMGQPGYLFKRTLFHQTFVPNFDEQHLDHAHCEFCNDYFSLQGDYLKEGYYEKESKSWICETCFHDFKILFGWKEG